MNIKLIRKILRITFFLSLLIVLLVVGLNLYIKHSAGNLIFKKTDDIPPKYTALVLGAHVGNDGTPSIVLSDRLFKALELYRKGKVKRFLLSGDHGRKNYDEVNNMKRVLKDSGVPEQNIFLDHAGFDTYNSIVRAKEIFQVHDMIIVTQEFHLSRALFIAKRKGLNAVGCVAEMSDKAPLKSLKFRESLANIKAFFEVLINRKPKFLGPKVPIYGDSKLSYD
jgi:SanA protein